MPLDGCPPGTYQADGNPLPTVSVRLSICSTDSFAVFTGSELSVSEFIGAKDTDAQFFTFNFAVPNKASVYIVEWSRYNGLLALTG